MVIDALFLLVPGTVAIELHVYIIYWLESDVRNVLANLDHGATIFHGSKDRAD